MRLIVLTYANIKCPEYNNFMKSTAHLNVHVLGRGEKWKSFVESKIQACYNWLLTLKEPCIVCLTDCFDLIACADEHEIISKYVNFNAPIVFGTETLCPSNNCRPPKKLWTHLEAKRKL